MNLNVITTILSQAGIGTLGRDLFLDHMPDPVLTGVMVRLPVDGVAMSGYLPGYFRDGKVQAIVRSPDYDTGQILAGRVLKALTLRLKANYLDDDGNLLVTINTMRALGLPIPYARTPGNLTEWSVNFTANYRLPGFDA